MSAEIRGYAFGPFRIDAGERLLRRGDEVIPLPPKVIETLLVLVGDAGRMVEKGELLKTVWPETFVEEGALTRNVSLLRKILGDATDEPVYIETIPKRGYRFIGAVRALTEADASPAATASRPESAVSAADAPPAKPVRKWGHLLIASLALAAVVVGAFAVSIFISAPAPALKPMSLPVTALAVLPFRTVGSDGDDYFADGMTQALITDLAKFGKLRVISLASGSGGGDERSAINAVARQQMAGLVLQGTVHRAGERVRVDAQLMDPKTRTVHWANFYERDVKDVLALESALAEAIVGEIQVHLTTEERGRLLGRKRVAPAALDAYMRGRHLWNQRTEETLRKAVQYFKQAIDVDPTYAAAYSGLADSYSLLGSIGVDAMPPMQAMPLAKAAAQKAIDIDPETAEGHVSMAYIKLSFDWDLPGAQQEFARAISLNSAWATTHHWYSHYYMAAGDLDKAMTEMQAALTLEPLSPAINVGVGWCYYYSRQYDKAIDQFRAVVEMNPHFPLAHRTMGMAYQQKGMYPEAIEHFKTAVELSHGGSSAVSALAAAYGSAGKASEARQGRIRLEAEARNKYVPAIYFAAVALSLGEFPSADTWIKRAFIERSDYLIYLRVEPLAGKLSARPEFARAMARLHP